MITVYSPRIHNLGDFSHCLPALSGLYKKTGEKISFGICDKLSIFRGIKSLLLHQEMFVEVFFVSEKPISTNYLVVEDYGKDPDIITNARSSHRSVSFINDNYGLDIEIDDDFELHVPYFGEIDYHDDKILIGDRWSPNQCASVDTRRQYEVLKNSGKFNDDRFLYLDYCDDLVYNCSLIKYNPNPFYTTFTGIGILSDLMHKETYVMWDDDMRMWNGEPVENDFDLHYSKIRNSHLVYIKDFSWN